MSFSKKLIDKTIKFTQTVYKINLNQPEISIPPEILSLIPKIDETKVLARKQNSNSIIISAQLEFDHRFTLISTVLGFISSKKVQNSQMQYLSLIILQSCCGIFFWELQNIGSHIILVFIRAFCSSVPFLPNIKNELKNFFSLFIERIYFYGGIDLTIQYLPAINEVMSKFPQLSDFCIPLLLKITKKLCKKLNSENAPINQTNISYFFHNLSRIISKLPHQNLDSQKIIQRILELSKIPTPAYLLDSYLSLLLSFHFHTQELIPLIEQISNGFINADSSSLNHNLISTPKISLNEEINVVLTKENNEIIHEYEDFFSKEKPPIPKIPNLSEIPQIVSGDAINAATHIADHFNNSCKISDYLEFLIILLNSPNFNVRAILIICILISGPIRVQISELFAKKNLWKYLLNESTFSPVINIFNDPFSRLVNLRQSVFDVLSFMCTKDEITLSIRSAFSNFLSKIAKDPKFASEIVLLSYPSLKPIYLINVPETEEDNLLNYLFEITIIQQYDFFNDPKNALNYCFPTLFTILSILENNDACLEIVANSLYSCKALLSLLFEYPLIPYLEKLLINLASIASNKKNKIVPFAEAIHDFFQLIIGRPEFSNLLLTVLKIIESNPATVFLKVNLINDLFSAAFSCENEQLKDREEILEYFLKILLKFKNFQAFNPSIVPFKKLANVCNLVGSYVTTDKDGTIHKNKIFEILYEICISDDIISLPEGLPMLMLSLKDKESQNYMISKLIELCSSSSINRCSCLIGKIPSILFKKKYQINFELYKLISLTISNPKSLRAFFQCFESDEIFDEALRNLSMIIDAVNTDPFRPRIQFSTIGSYVKLPPISSSILENGFIVHSTLFIESSEPNRNFFVLKGGTKTISVRFLRESVLLLIEADNFNHQFIFDANYPLSRWLSFSLMLKPSEGLIIEFDGSIIAGLSIESIELDNNIDCEFSFFTNFNENPKPIQMHSISLYANFSVDELSISNFDYIKTINQHLIYSFTANNIVKRNMVNENTISAFSGTSIQFECQFLRSFEITQSINVLLTLFRKVEYKPKLLDPLLSIIFKIIHKSPVVSDQMVKINGMAVISYFLEKLSANDLSMERWKFFVYQTEKIKLNQLLYQFAKFIYYNMNIWSHASLDVQKQVICDWQRTEVLYDEFLTVPFLLETFSFFCRINQSNFDQNTNSFFTLNSFMSNIKRNKTRSKTGKRRVNVPLSPNSSMNLILDKNSNNNSQISSDLLTPISSASSSIDFTQYVKSENSQEPNNINKEVSNSLFVGDNNNSTDTTDDISADYSNADISANDSINDLNSIKNIGDSNCSNDINANNESNELNVNDESNKANVNNENNESNANNENNESNANNESNESNTNNEINESNTNNEINNESNNLNINNESNNLNINNESNNVSDTIIDDSNDIESIDECSEFISVDGNNEIMNVEGDDQSSSLSNSKAQDESINSFALNQKRQETRIKKAVSFYKRSSSIEELSNPNFSPISYSKSISSISYQKMVKEKLHVIRMIIISLIKSILSMKKLNKKEAFFLFQTIKRAKDTEEALSLLEVVSFAIDTKLYLTTFDIQGQWLMLFLHRNETFRIKWLQLFSKMYPSPSPSLAQSILFILIVQSQLVLNDSTLSTQSLLVESIRICLDIHPRLDLNKIKETAFDLSKVRVQYFHFAIAISIAAPDKLNDSFASALVSLISNKEFGIIVSASSSTINLFLLIYWALKRSQCQKDKDECLKMPFGQIKANGYNQFSFPLKIDSVDKKAIFVLSHICSFSPIHARTAIGIIDSISTLTKADLSELRSEFLSSLLQIESSPEFIQLISESIFFHYKILNIPTLNPLFTTYNPKHKPRKRFDAQVPDLITLVNVYIGDIDLSPTSVFSLNISSNGVWLDESLAKTLICIVSASNYEKLKPIVSMLIYFFCRGQTQVEIATLVPLVKQFFAEKDNYSYLIIYSIYREKILSFFNLNSTPNNIAQNDLYQRKRRQTELFTNASDPLSRFKRRFSSVNQYPKYVQYQDQQEEDEFVKNEMNENDAILDDNQNEPKVTISINPMPRKHHRSYSPPSGSDINNFIVPSMNVNNSDFPVYEFENDLPESVKLIIKSDPKFLRICYITLSQFCEEAPKTLTEVHQNLIDLFSSIQSVFSASTYHKCAIHQTEKYMGKRAWEYLSHQMFTGNQSHFKRSSFTDRLSRPIILKRNFGFDKKLTEMKNAKKADSSIENCIDSNEPLFEGQCERIKVDKTINGTFYVIFTGIHRFENDENKPQDKKIIRFVSNEGKILIIPVDSIVRILPMFVLQKKTAVEILTEQQRSYLFNFELPIHVNQFVSSLMPTNLQFPNDKFLNSLTESWCKRNISNFEYLTWLNLLSGRTFNSAYSYPIFPWVLSDYSSKIVNLDDPKVYRDLSKPIGVLNPARLQKLKMLRNDNPEEDNNFLYRSTYSCAFHVFHYLVRLEPFTSLHIAMQDGKFDVAHRLFSSISNAYERITSTIFNFRELIPEFFFNSNFLVNLDKFKFGGGIDDVQLPPWSKSPIDFIYKNRRALESEIVSSHINEWIDLIWGYKQTGQAAEDADNVFDPHIYPNVWQRYKLTDNNNDSGNDYGSKTIKNASIQIKPAYGSTNGLSQTSSISTLSITNTIEGSPSVISPSSSDTSQYLNENSSLLYKNPAVEPGSVPQSVLNSTSKQQIEELLSHVGQIPQQLFDSPHPSRQPSPQSLIVSAFPPSSSFIYVPTSNKASSKTSLTSNKLNNKNTLVQTDSILDLAVSSIPVPKSSVVDSGKNVKEIKRIYMYLDFTFVCVPSGENNPIRAIDEKHLTFRDDGRVFNFTTPITKERFHHLKNFINFGPCSFAAIRTSTNEIIYVESSTNGNSSTANGISLSSSSSSLNDLDSVSVQRRKSEFHVSQITAMCKIGKTLFTGDNDGIVANESTEAILTVHRKPITCLGGCEDLRIIVSVSSDNLVVISSADDLCFIRSFKIDRSFGKVSKVVICKGFAIINFLINSSSNESKILAYSVNGDFIGSISLNFNIIHMISMTFNSDDLDLLALADNNKKVYLINAFELKELIELKEVESQITCLAFFPQLNQQLAIGTEIGVLYYGNINV